MRRSMRFLALVLVLAAAVSAQVILHANTTKPVVLGYDASRNQLHWTISSGATGYRIYRGNATNGPFSLIGMTRFKLFYVDYSANGHPYYYVVTAFAPSCTSSTPVGQPCGESVYSNVVSNH
jgi:fibronectin type 3 domain-containing protein